MGGGISEQPLLKNTFPLCNIYAINRYIHTYIIDEWVVTFFYCYFRIFLMYLPKS
jgi:hypothetical protein